MSNIIFIAIALLIGLGAGYLMRIKFLKSKGEDFLEKSEQLLKEAEEKAQKLVQEAKQKSQKLQDELIQEEREKRNEINRIEDRLLKKEEELEKRI